MGDERSDAIIDHVQSDADDASSGHTSVLASPVAAGLGDIDCSTAGGSSIALAEVSTPCNCSIVGAPARP